jgi:ornithine--oxo-acid transaminase
LPLELLQPERLSHPATPADDAYRNFVNPEWVRLLGLLGMNVKYRSCHGTELHTEDGRIILDFLSGYCVYNAGHNHPHIVGELIRELQSSGPTMLQSHAAGSAGTLAERLTSLTGAHLTKTFFCSSGSEGVEAAIKFARVFTERNGIVYAKGAFHGLTCGALSLMGDPFWKEGFGPMLPETHEVPFGDTAALEATLRQHKVAAVILEPLQGEAGIIPPPHNYFATVQSLCKKHGALFVLDEVQTGIGRTGTFIAANRDHLRPDMVILAKALSGGLVPVAAVLMRDEIYKSVYGSLKKSIIHTSTFSENALSMRAGLATLDVIESEDLAARAEVVGAQLRDQLHQRLNRFEMFSEVRGLGLLNGVALQPPSSLRLRVPFQTFHAIHPGMFGQMLVKRLFEHHNILAQICGNNFMVLKVAPPLVITESQVAQYLDAIEAVMETVHSSASFWSDALSMAQRAVRI